MTIERSLSHVAAVIDEHGGLRTVVTRRRKDFARYHCGPCERIFVVPDYRVEEPVPWDEVPTVIARATAYVAEWIRGRNDPDALTHPAIAAYRRRWRL